MQLMHVRAVLSAVAFSREQSQLSDQQEFLNLNQEQGKHNVILKQTFLFKLRFCNRMVVCAFIQVLSLR